MKQYQDSYNQLVERIRELAIKDSRVYTLESAWNLFDLGLECEDLEPTLFQATSALKQVIKEAQDE